MFGPHSYLGRDDLKRSLGSTVSAKDVDLRRALEAVSAEIDDWLHRTFQPYQAELVYSATSGQSLSVDDLISADSVAMDQDGDRVYEVSLATSDWEAGPANAPARHQPYQWLDVQPNGRWRFTTVRRGVKVTGTWGFWQDLAANGARLSSALDATSTSFALASSTALQPQQTILIGSEQIYIGDISGTTAYVERGANGTSATSHTTANAIQVYRYPAPVVEACRLQSLRVHKRTDAPLGIVAGGLDVTEGVVQVMRLDPDVEKLIQSYRRFEFLGV